MSTKIKKLIPLISVFLCLFALPFGAFATSGGGNNPYQIGQGLSRVTNSYTWGSATASISVTGLSPYWDDFSRDVISSGSTNLQSEELTIIIPVLVSFSIYNSTDYPISNNYRNIYTNLSGHVNFTNGASTVGYSWSSPDLVGVSVIGGDFLPESVIGSSSNTYGIGFRSDQAFSFNRSYFIPPHSSLSSSFIAYFSFSGSGYGPFNNQFDNLTWDNTIDSAILYTESTNFSSYSWSELGRIPSDYASSEIINSIDDLEAYVLTLNTDLTNIYSRLATTNSYIQSVGNKIDTVGGKIDTTNSKIDISNTRLQSIITTLTNFYNTYLEVNNVDTSGADSSIDEATSAVDEVHSTEQSLFEMGEQSVSEVSFETFSFDTGVRRGLGWVSDEFAFLWNSLGGAVIIYVFPLMLTLALTILRYQRAERVTHARIAATESWNRQRAISLGHRVRHRRHNH